MTTRGQAVRDALARYGLKLAGEDLGNVARGRVPMVALDPAMERQRWAKGIDAAFEDNAQIDPTTRDPEPGVIHRADA